jgi:hypothetical protein
MSRSTNQFPARTRRPGWFWAALALMFCGLVIQQIAPLIQVQHEQLEARAEQLAVQSGGNHGKAPAHHHDESKCQFCQNAIHATLLTYLVVAMVTTGSAEPHRSIPLDSIARPTPDTRCAASPRGPPACA